jgi:hypothetical protein
MSNPSTPTAASVSGRPAVPPNTVNPRFNAVHSPAEYVKELARYNEAKDRASFAAIEALRKKHSHLGNGNYNDSNPDDPDASAQHREHVLFLFCFIARPSSTCDMYVRYNKQYTINGSVDMYKVNNRSFNRCRAP